MNNITTQRRILRVRKKLKKVNKNRPRLSIFRSAKNIYAQIIDDKNNKTMVSASSLERDFNKNDNNKEKKTYLSTKVGEILAKRAIEKKIDKIFLDRGKYKYHGRIKLLVETLRKKGLDL